MTHYQINLLLLSLLSSHDKMRKFTQNVTNSNCQCQHYVQSACSLHKILQFVFNPENDASLIKITAKFVTSIPICGISLNNKDNINWFFLEITCKHDNLVGFPLNSKHLNMNLYLVFP